MDYQLVLKKRFKFKRKVKNVDALAEKLGVSRSSVYNWIKGKNVPTSRMIEKIRALEE